MLCVKYCTHVDAIFFVIWYSDKTVLVNCFIHMNALYNYNHHDQYTQIEKSHSFASTY